MAAGYLSSEIRNCALDLIGLQIPHRYVRGKNHGKRNGESWQWDMRVHADGKEALLEALQERVYTYEQERHDTLLTAWDRLGQAGAFLLDTSEPPERNLHVVFTDSRALAAVRFRSFMRDIRRIDRPFYRPASAAPSCAGPQECV